jgi:hypothetical protein
MQTEPFYPVGIQDFEKIRRMNALYVDKTALIYRLVHRSVNVFLSRPRRFGKSLLTSTIQCYFEGRKELFHGLKIEQLEQEWTVYPVFHFDLSQAKGLPIDQMEEAISDQLMSYEALYGSNEGAKNLGSRLSGLIHRAYEKTGQQVVVLIDEYDAPLLDVIHDDQQREEVRRMLRNFYTPLKSCDAYVRFVFLTGISMFSQVSIFSELNNLEIISRVGEYETICGITQQELLDNFQYGIKTLSQALQCSEDEAVSLLKDRYDGYHFCEESEGLFNPFSLLNAFKYKKLESYWFRSGTPTFLIEMLKKYRDNGASVLDHLEQKEPVVSESFESPIETQSDPTPLLYQAGYITIKGYEPRSGVFYLGIPNSEVRVGLLQNLLPLYAPVNAKSVQSVVARASESLKTGDYQQALTLFQSMLSGIPYMRGDAAILDDVEKTEAYYHRLFYFFFRMLYNEVYAEVRNALGASDITIFTPKFIYIFEIKIDASAETALRQIRQKEYAAPYLSDGRRVITVGINFSTQRRTIDDWKVGEE